MIDYKEISGEKAAIYLNFPFCRLPCSYCHYVDNLQFGYDRIPDDYVNNIVKQLKDILLELNGKTLESIYFGGGTPSLLNDNQLEIIMEQFAIHNVKANEISIEIHPGMCNFDYVNNSFFTRYSIGVQTVCKELAIDYRRTSYDKAKLIELVSNIRNAKKRKIINFDFVFEEKLSLDEIEFVNALEPETVTFYPNTQGKGSERLRNVLITLESVKNSLIGYETLGKSKFIYIKKGCTQSRYSKLEYEEYGNIIGVGHNSVSYIGDNSYLCLYDGDNIKIINRNQKKGNRLLSALLMGMATGVKKSYIFNIMPDVYDKHFLYTINSETDVCDKHIEVLDDELVYLPENEYIRFCEYLLDNYSELYQHIFVSAICYGDSNINVARQVYNTEFIDYKSGNSVIKTKTKAPNIKILVEGIDGSGKDTFVRFLVNELKKYYYYDNNSRISVTGQPNSKFEMGKVAKKFIEELDLDMDKETVAIALRNNRYASEKEISNLPGIVILIRGLVTDEATFAYRFGEKTYLGEGKYVSKWDKYIVVDIDVEKANSQIESRGIERTWREYPEHLDYFRKYYLAYENDIFLSKEIIHNNGSIEELKAKAIDLAERIYEEFKPKK